MHTQSFVATHDRGQRYTTFQGTRAVNLRKLIKSFDVDFLAAALGIRPAVLQDMVSGRQTGDEYMPQIQERLKSAGMPGHLLDIPKMVVDFRTIRQFKKLVDTAQDKTPVRRSNLCKLMYEFEGRLGLLADALEVTEQSLVKVASGELAFDEQRFGHINPRLVKAGFSDGWLEDPNSRVNDDLVGKLETLAADEYQAYLAEAARERELRQVAQEKVVEPAIAAEQQTSPQRPEGSSQAFEAAEELKPTQDISTDDASIIPGGVTVTIKKKKVSSSASTNVASKEVASAVAPQETKKTVRVHRILKEELAKLDKEIQQTRKPAGKASRKGDETSKELSAARVEALDKLLSGARRGAKGHLWTNMLGWTLSHWSNIRAGRVRLRSDSARTIESHLQLPQGWLDSPEFPPKSIAPWVFDAALDMPGAVAKKPKENGKSQRKITEYQMSRIKPRVSPQLFQTYGGSIPPANMVGPEAPSAGVANPTSTMARTAPQPVVADAPRKRGRPRKVLAQPTPSDTPSVPATVGNNPMVAAAPLAPATTPMKAKPQSAVSSVSPTIQPESAAGYVWTPANGAAQKEASPIVKTVYTVLEKLHMEGKFTDSDALNLMQFLLKQ